MTGFYMSLMVRKFYQKEFLAEMNAHKDGDRFLLLPSEAAKIVGDRWSVDPTIVILSFGEQKP